MAIFCKTPAPTSTPTTTVSTPQLPAWYQDAMQRLVQAGEAEVKGTPYEYYDPARRVAPLSATEQQAIAQVPQAAGAYMPGLAAGFESAALGTRGVEDIDYSQYMNPYTQYVTDIAKREAVRDFEKMRPQMGFQASRQGAFGGARYGVQEAEAERNLGQRLADIQQTGLERAFTAGTGLQQQEAQRQLQGAPLFSQMGSQAQQLGLGGLQSIMSSQALPRQLEQQQRDLAFQEYQRGQGYGMQRLGQLGGLLGMVQQPPTTTTTGQQFTPQMSPITAAAGLGTTALGIYGLNQTFPNLFGGSDRRLKTNIEEIGVLKDGQKLYRYTLANGKWQIGLMADEVEKIYPEAVVEVNGLKMVNYKVATDNAAEAS